MSKGSRAINTYEFGDSRPDDQSWPKSAEVLIAEGWYRFPAPRKRPSSPPPPIAPKELGNRDVVPDKIGCRTRRKWKGMLSSPLCGGSQTLAPPESDMRGWKERRHQACVPSTTSERHEKVSPG
ncbi:hypothetical protein PAPYR_4134 [Paratrimastix pyriformis]|uniref:Uncharacterized protein n=1 Tax=Paratrimastix pyriformis TaxID=342808 RepID=A0ABQ8UMQ4_9EUKA|nr:hypothetical protein PAPYR_4134 [Paratrimastix pyriformis]